MPSVLIADDEVRYRDLLGSYLTNSGYRVEIASDGLEAIRKGSLAQHDVLVADWMLAGRVHGLQVVETVGAAAPHTTSVVITGFPSPDLRSQAQCHGVYHFLEKPFSLDQFGVAVEGALHHGEKRGQEGLLGVFAVDAQGIVGKANKRGRQMLAALDDDPRPVVARDIFGDRPDEQLRRASDDWLDVRPGGQDVTWRLKARRDTEGGWVVVAVEHGDDPAVRRRLVFYARVIQLLLGQDKTDQVIWPHDGRLLVVDDDAAIRNLVGRVAEQAGAVCHAANSHELARRIFAADRGIRYVLADYDMPEAGLDTLVETLRSERDDAVIVGMSGEYHDDHVSTGVRRFVPKPWRARDLVDAFTD